MKDVSSRIMGPKQGPKTIIFKPHHGEASEYQREIFQKLCGEKKSYTKLEVQESLDFSVAILGPERNGKVPQNFRQKKMFSPKLNVQQNC